MKRNFCFILLQLFLVFSFVAEAQTPEFKTIQAGIEHAQFTKQIKISETEAAPVAVNLLRLDLKKVRLDVVHALDAAIGLEKTSSIATRHGAFAAINAGFFKIDGLYRGDAAGTLMIDGKLLSESNNNRISLGIINGKDKTEVNFGHLDLNYLGFIEKSSLEFNGINRERKKDELIIFTPEFGRTTLTEPNGTEVIIRNGQVTAILKTGSNLIPPDGFVLSATGKAEESLLKISKIRAKFKLSPIAFDSLIMLDNEKERKEEEKKRELLLTFDDNLLKKMEDIVAGVPQLIKNGKIAITWELEKIGKSFAETRHPRTAIAKLKDNKLLMIAVDGRQTGYSVGMNLQELAEMLLEFGAVDAMNLDGGGSTTMFLDGKIMNKPSDKEGERSVSDAILVFPRKKP